MNSLEKVLIIAIYLSQTIQHWENCLVVEGMKLQKEFVATLVAMLYKKPIAVSEIVSRIAWVIKTLIISP